MRLRYLRDDGPRRRHRHARFGRRVIERRTYDERIEPESATEFGTVCIASNRSPHPGRLPEYEGTFRNR